MHWSAWSRNIQMYWRRERKIKSHLDYYKFIYPQVTNQPGNNWVHMHISSKYFATYVRCPQHSAQGCHDASQHFPDAHQMILESGWDHAQHGF